MSLTLSKKIVSEEEKEGTNVTETWDLSRVLEGSSSVPCMGEDCTAKAIAAWATNLEPDQEWNCCEQCQLTEFGGWPINAAPPTSETTVAVDKPTSEPPVGDDGETKEPEDGQTTKDSISVAAVELQDVKIDSETAAADTKVEHETTVPVDVKVEPEVPSGTLLEAEGPPPQVSETLMDKEECPQVVDGTTDKALPEADSPQANPIEPDESKASSLLSENSNIKANDIDNSVAVPQVAVDVVPKVSSFSENNDVKASAVDNSAAVPQAAADAVSDADVKVQPQEEPVEAWDLQKVMTRADLESNPVMCTSETCSLLAACVYISSLDPSNPWSSCLDCQELDFGGWPEAHELPIKEMAQEDKDALAKYCSNKKEITWPTFPPKEPEEQPFVESWDLKKVMSIQDLDEFPIKCSTETCTMLAACTYVSNHTPPTKWYSCLDCQELDYGGWPEPSEIPLREMSPEHKKVLISKCSKKNTVDMPDLAPQVKSPAKTIDGASHTIFTPEPHQNGKPTVTPSPAIVSKESKTKGKMSKQLLELHRKWQLAAEKAGGPGARIVVGKPDAKKLIFDMLYSQFRPMTINQINTELKCVVPPPVLKACLDDMALDPFNSDEIFADSDDDGEESSKKKKKKKSKKNETTHSDSYASSLSLKAGRSANASLYYVDHSKCKNNGNGLPRAERDELFSAYHKVKSEIADLEARINKAKTETAKLLSEPTNEEAAIQLEREEAATAELLAKVEDGRKHKVDEKHKKKMKDNVVVMASHWRKRRRICMDFLIAMEENTDGTISLKKCLKGDGQIEIDSDEAIIKGATQAARDKKRPGRPLKKAKRSELSPSEDFIGVTLNSQGVVERVYLED